MMDRKNSPTQSGYKLHQPLFSRSNPIPSGYNPKNAPTLTLTRPHPAAALKMRRGSL